MTKEEREQNALEEKIRTIVGKMSRKEWRDACDALGVARADMDDLDLTVILAHKIDNTKSYDHYNEMSSDDLNAIVEKGVA